MKRGTFWILLSCLMVTSLALASCSKSTTTSTSASTTIPTTKTTTTASTVTTAAPLTTTVTTTTTTTGNWWDSLGKPQYGGTMTLRINNNFTSFDPYQGVMGTEIYSGYLEQMLTPDWTMNPAIDNYQLSFYSNDVAAGLLAQSWEFTSPGIFVIHLRQGIHWQNIAPANGRQFTADDIVFHFDRMLGLGNGYTKPAPYWGTVAWTKSLISVTAPDKYTVVFEWNTPNPEFVLETFEAIDVSTCIENPEAVKLWGDLSDWHHAIGTGAFILQDFISGSSATLVKNPDYWGYDERYPQNRLPYVDKVVYLIITDPATTLSAFRTGKIDIVDGMQYQQAQQMKKTNPEITEITYYATSGITLDPRNDKAPFNDIRVREALQMAIDLPTIASSYYLGTADPWPLPLTSNYMTGWGFPYSQWPQELKDEYAYNPTAAKKLLADAGYPNGFKTDVVVDSANDMDLLQIVKSYFTAIGVNMDIRPMDTASLTSFVTINHQNDALAERNTGTLSLSVYPLRHLSRLQTGSSANVAMVSDPIFDAFYTQAMNATSTDHVKQVLKDANEYVAQKHFVISLLAPNLFGFCQPWLKGYNAQTAAVSGPNGPLLLFFYGARYWIDQSVTKP